MNAIPNSLTAIGVENLCRWISRSPSFQAVCGISPADPTKAMESVYPYALTPEGDDVFSLESLESLRPMALVFPVPEGSMAVRIADGQWESHESFIVQIHFDTDEGSSAREASVAAHNFASAIRNELLRESAVEAAERIAIAKASTVVTRSNMDEASSSGDSWVIEIAIDI